MHKKYFNLLIIGDSRVGKTTYLRHFNNHNFTTNTGDIRFNIKEIPGKDVYLNLLNLDFRNPNCVILMFDITSRITYKNIPNWHRDIVCIYGDIPIVICGNKSDIKKNKTIKCSYFLKKKNLQYFDISAKYNINIVGPFLWLARQLVGNPQLLFTAGPVLAPHKVQIETQLIQQHSIETEVDNFIIKFEQMKLFQEI